MRKPSNTKVPSVDQNKNAVAYNNEMNPGLLQQMKLFEEVKKTPSSTKLEYDVEAYSETALSHRMQIEKLESADDTKPGRISEMKLLHMLQLYRECGDKIYTAKGLRDQLPTKTFENIFNYFSILATVNKPST